MSGCDHCNGVDELCASCKAWQRAHIETETREKTQREIAAWLRALAIEHNEVVAGMWADDIERGEWRTK